MFIFARQRRYMRYFIQLSYNGTNYCGWQIQPNGPSIQEELNTALSTLLRAEISVVGAGRTDTGVHAKQMFAHFNVDQPIDTTDLAFRLNRFLPAAIGIQNIFAVADDAHTRFSATSRSYQYFVTPQKDPFLTEWAWQLERTLNIEAMNHCAKLLLGEQDFSAFSKAHTQTKTNMCHVTKAYWEEQESLLIFHISANRFLRNMVRAIVGTLVEVGLNKMDAEAFSKVIAQKSRSKAGSSAPAKGLYLTHVEYPNSIYIHGAS